MKTGLILEPPKRKDYAYERIYGAADRTVRIEPIGRDISNVPIVFQGDVPTCVSATITWIRQYMSEDKPDLAHEYLADLSKTGKAGAKPSQVLEPARKVGIVTQQTWDTGLPAEFEREANGYRIKYARLEDLSLHGLYAAIQRDPIAIGVRDFRGIGPHFLAAFDVTPDGLAFKCANWHRPDVQDVVEIPFSDVVVAYAILPPDTRLPASNFRVGLLGALKGVFAFRKAVLGLLGVLLAGTGLVFWSGTGTDFGAGYTPITGYESTLTSRVDTDDTAFPVVSVVDRAGNALAFANVSPSSTVRVYFTLEPGSSREEIAYCTGISGSSFTPCVRGLAFQGDSLSSSSTLAKIHPPGSKIIISNVGVFYREFVSIDGTQRVDGTKYFSSIPRQSATTTLPTANDQYATKYYVDSVGAGGFTAANVSTTYGLQALGTSPETVGANVSSTASTNGGFIAITGGKIYWDVVNFLAGSWTWGGLNTFSATTTFAKVPVDSNGSTFGVPVGTVMAYATSTMPNGWLATDGSLVSRTTYSALFGVIGTTYGAGNGTSTFALPDLRGKTTFMASSTAAGFTTYGFTSGSSTHTMSVAELVPHTHQTAIDNSGTAGTARAGQTTNGAGAQVESESTGSGAAMNIMNPYMVMNYMIKY